MVSWSRGRMRRCRMRRGVPSMTARSCPTLPGRGRSLLLEARPAQTAMSARLEASRQRQLPTMLRQAARTVGETRMRRVAWSSSRSRSCQPGFARTCWLHLQTLNVAARGQPLSTGHAERRQQTALLTDQDVLQAA
jgi:hypothetical protein